MLVADDDDGFALGEAGCEKLEAVTD